MKLPIQSFLQRGSHDCGAACVYMVMRWWNIRTSYEDVRHGLAVHELDGASPDMIEAFLRRSGLRVVSGEFSMNDLLAAIKQGRPTIVPTSEGGGHYMVAHGLVGNTVYLMDPLEGEVTRLRSKFIASWVDTTRRGVEYASWAIAAWK